MGLLDRLLHLEEPSESIHAFMGALAVYNRTNQPGYTGTVYTRQNFRDDFNVSGSAEIQAIGSILDQIDAGTLRSEEIEGVLLMGLEKPSIVDKNFVLNFLGF